ncbi:MAG: AAA family ATPase [Thermoguttaceae bacterium]|jgi:replication-associated recombination protein RarA
MQRLYERWRPKTLDAVIGQPVTRALAQFAVEPYPNIFILEGQSGTGKTATAMILANTLADTGWFGGSEYAEIGTRFDVETMRRYFDRATTPFRYCVSAGKFHILRIEELERLHPTVQNELKEALEDAQRRYRLIVIATSNDTSRLEQALRDRFKMFPFSCGPDFAEAVNDWLPAVWAAEVGSGVDLPYGYQSLGWEGEHFSARRALDGLEKYIALERTGKGMVAA